jgi:trehalose 6-phosphate synthase/phosphatase
MAEDSGETAATSGEGHRVVVVSNRLPVRLVESDGQWDVIPSSGGLVTALKPVLDGRGGAWIGWPGVEGEQAWEALDEHETGHKLVPVSLSQEEINDYYHGFSNEVLWPLFHDLSSRCNFDPRYWPVYQRVNRRFAKTVVLSTHFDDYIWVQDYHLMLCGALLREMGVQRRIGFFLHIPFPPLDMFLKLPWRNELLEGLLAYDLVGFQTARDKRHFIQCVRALRRETRLADGHRSVSTLSIGERDMRVGAFPIGIDFESFAQEASSKPVSDGAWYIHEQQPHRQLLLGVDRLDYTKGLPARISAIGAMLERHPEMRGKCTFIQVVVPSRTSVPEYQQLRSEVERRVGEVNGRFTTAGWTPIHYIYRSLDRTELLSYYRTSEVALITPLKDGMNLVAKEYCACSLERGVLVLSEFAGAAAQLHKYALLVNPNDQQGLADTIHRALTMDEKERRERMRGLRRSIARHNVFWWVSQFLRAAFSVDLESFPRQEYFVPPPRRLEEQDVSERTD